MSGRPSHPSQRFQELIAQYRQIHEHGLHFSGRFEPNVFSGHSLARHVAPLRELLQRVGARTLLDYGCGKATLHNKTDFELAPGLRIASLKDYWGLEEVALYDPAVAQYAELPDRMFDAVIRTDVLEHVDEADVAYVLGQMFAHARRLVFANIAAFPAVKVLPNGENAHATIRPAAWWQERIEAAAEASQAAYHCIVETRDGSHHLRSD